MKILIAIDDSPYSQHVLDLVCRRHWPEDVEFKVLNVIEPLPVSNNSTDDWCGIQNELSSKRRSHAERLCADARQRLERHFPCARVHFEIRQGSPRREIVMAAAEWEAGRIIIGAHGHDVCPHNLLGSVSRSVAETAPCSVEVIRYRTPVKTHAQEIEEKNEQAAIR